MWITFIAINLFLCVVKREKKPQKYELLFHVITWGVDLGFALIILASDGFGDAGLWYDLICECASEVSEVSEWSE